MFEAAVSAICFCHLIKMSEITHILWYLNKNMKVKQKNGHNNTPTKCLT